MPVNSEIGTGHSSRLALRRPRCNLSHILNGEGGTSRWVGICRGLERYGYDFVSSTSAAVTHSDVPSWWKVDLAELLSALCRHGSDLAGVPACSIVVRGSSGEFFSVASSAEWACALDDFQLSEEAGPTWECCVTAQATRSDDLDSRGLTGSRLSDPASNHGIVGCQAVPLTSSGDTWGALSLYWGADTRGDGLLVTAIAVAAIVARAIEFQYGQETARADEPAALPGIVGLAASAEHGPDTRDARAVARDLRAAARDARAAERDARAAERDGRAAARDREARRRDELAGRVDPTTVMEQVLARRDRYAAARDRFHARSDRASSRLDRIVSANERVESSIDGLTGAYRRDAGLLELEHEVDRARRTGDAFVLAFVDVNNLKARNDQHGHLAGDELLRKIADTLRANVRSYDLVVRYGGDEFVCGFPALEVNDAAERFARINEDLAASDDASVAFGLAELEEGDSLTDLIAKADSLMYANRFKRAQTRANASLAPGPVPSAAE
jgi:diguanylate cyclase (GGDEF)-like protein